MFLLYVSPQVDMKWIEKLHEKMKCVRLISPFGAKDKITVQCTVSKKTMHFTNTLDATRFMKENYNQEAIDAHTYFDKQRTVNFIIPKPVIQHATAHDEAFFVKIIEACSEKNYRVCPIFNFNYNNWMIQMGDGTTVVGKRDISSFVLAKQ